MTHFYERPKLKCILWRDFVIFVNPGTEYTLATEKNFIKGSLPETENEIEALRQKNSGNPNALAILSNKVMRQLMRRYS